MARNGGARWTMVGRSAAMQLNGWTDCDLAVVLCIFAVAGQMGDLCWLFKLLERWCQKMVMMAMCTRLDEQQRGGSRLHVEGSGDDVDINISGDIAAVFGSDGASMKNDQSGYTAVARRRAAVRVAVMLVAKR